LNILLKFY
jgi:hypothetical protein